MPETIHRLGVHTLAVDVLLLECFRDWLTASLASIRSRVSALTVDQRDVEDFLQYVLFRHEIPPVEPDVADTLAKVILLLYAESNRGKFAALVAAYPSLQAVLLIFRACLTVADQK